MKKTKTTATVSSGSTGAAGGSSSPSSSPNDRTTGTAEMEEIRSLREHILSCTSVPPNSRALLVALSALDAETARIERDERLRRKFAAASASTSTAAPGGLAERDSSSPVLVERGVASVNSARVGSGSGPVSSTAMDDDEDEWQDASPPIRGGPAGAGGAGDVAMNDLDGGGFCDAPSPLGSKLAEMAIASLADHGARASTPLGVLALAIHAALRSDALDFRCTGVPPSKKSGGAGGFAPPIRELPRTVFLPTGWEEEANAAVVDENNGGAGGGSGRLGGPPHLSRLGCVALRYRKDGLGAVVLQVTLLPHGVAAVAVEDWAGCNDAEPIPLRGLPPGGGGRWSWEEMSPGDVEKLAARIELGPSSEGVEGDDCCRRRSLTFPLGRHVNVASLSAALASERASRGRTGKVSVPPALHYKSLPALLSDFAGRFDLGNVRDCGRSATDGDADDLAAVASAVVGVGVPPPERSGATFTSPSTIAVGGAGRTGQPPTPGVAPTIGDPRDPLRVGVGVGKRPGGDFDADLAPGGVVGPTFGDARGGGGMQVGPDHPIFDRPGGEEDLLSAYDGGGLVDPAGPTPRMGGGLGMQPRFDPYYPPGGPTDPGFVNPNGGRGRGLGRGRGRVGGDPNPDHMRPPSNLGGSSGGGQGRCGGDNFGMFS